MNLLVMHDSILGRDGEERWRWRWRWRDGVSQFRFWENAILAFDFDLISISILRLSSSGGSSSGSSSRYGVCMDDGLWTVDCGLWTMDYGL